MGFYEEGDISLEEGPKTVLQNSELCRVLLRRPIVSAILSVADRLSFSHLCFFSELARTNVKVAQLSPVLEIKSGELKQLDLLVSKYAQDPLLGDPDKIMESLLGPLTEVATMSNQVTAGESSCLPSFALPSCSMLDSVVDLLPFFVARSGTVVIETLVEALGGEHGTLRVLSRRRFSTSTDASHFSDQIEQTIKDPSNLTTSNLQLSPSRRSAITASLPSGDFLSRGKPAEDAPSPFTRSAS